jgi:hypothetical protein
VPGTHVHVIPDGDDLTGSGTTRDVTTFNQHLHDLDLPEDDTRTYQQAIRNGDHVVSVEVDDADALFAALAARAILTRPSALRTSFR